MRLRRQCAHPPLRILITRYVARSADDNAQVLEQAFSSAVSIHDSSLLAELVRTTAHDDVQTCTQSGERARRALQLSFCLESPCTPLHSLDMLERNSSCDVTQRRQEHTGGCASPAHRRRLESDDRNAGGDEVVITVTNGSLSYASTSGERALSLADLQRSALLLHVAEAAGSTQLACTVASFEAWLHLSRSIRADALSRWPDSWALCSGLCTADYLQDSATVAALVQAAGQALPACMLEKETQHPSLLKVRAHQACAFLGAAYVDCMCSGAACSALATCPREPHGQLCHLGRCN